MWTVELTCVAKATCLDASTTSCSCLRLVQYWAYQLSVFVCVKSPSDMQNNRTSRLAMLHLLFCSTILRLFMSNLVVTAVLHGLARPDRNLTPVLLAIFVDNNCLDYRTTCTVHLLLNLLAHCRGDLHACLRCETLMHIRVYLHKMPQGVTSIKQTQNRGRLEIMTRLSCTVLNSHLQKCKMQT